MSDTLIQFLGIAGLLYLGFSYLRAIPAVGWVFFSLAAILAGYSMVTALDGEVFVATGQSSVFAPNHSDSVWSSFA